jgi:hypothetical protein
MIRLGNSARFTPHEVDELRQIGLDVGNVKHQKDIEQEVSRWVNTLAGERFDLLEKIASAMAQSKGVNLPPKLSAACAETAIEHGPDFVPQFRGKPPR